MDELTGGKIEGVIGWDLLAGALLLEVLAPILLSHLPSATYANVKGEQRK